jgi:hypothetical protein
MGKSKGPFGGSSHCSANADAVWAVWTNPAAWPGGVIATAKIDGPFAVGARITTRKAPGLTQTIEHLVGPTESGTLLTERTVFTGPLASIAARVLGGRPRKTFDATTAHCARLAERHESG